MATDEPLAGPGENIMPRWSNSRFLVMGSLVLFCFCLGTRIPLRAAFLSGWDPVEFAFAIHHFDISQSLPHAPGYLVFVGLAKLLFWFVHDDNLALTTLAALFSALSTVLIFLLAFALYDRRTALLASAVWATCPLVWFHGLVGGIDAAAGFASVATALSVYLFLRSPSRSMAICAGGVYALAAGLRPDQLLLMAPLFLFPFLRSAACRRWALFAFCSALVVYLAWYIPTVASVGGYSNYARIAGEMFYGDLKKGSIFFGASPIAHIWMLTLLISGLALGLLPLLAISPIVYWFSWRRLKTSSGASGGCVCSVPTANVTQSSPNSSVVSASRLRRRGEHGESLLGGGLRAALWALRRPSVQAGSSGWNGALLLIVWAVPFLLFYSLIFIWRTGHCIALLPPILLLVSRRVVLSAVGLRAEGAKRFWSLVLFCVAVNAGFFFLVPRFPERAVAGKSYRLSQLLPEALNRSILSCGYDQIRFDQSVKRGYFAQIRNLLSRGNSAVLLMQRMPPECLNFRILEYYFPNVPVYAVTGLRDPAPGVHHPLVISVGKSASMPTGRSGGEGSGRGLTLGFAKGRVVLLQLKSLHLEVKARDGSAIEVVSEDWDEGLDPYQVYVLSLTPTSMVDVTSGRLAISITQ